jgi:hypothetical protein
MGMAKVRPCSLSYIRRKEKCGHLSRFKRQMQIRDRCVYKIHVILIKVVVNFWAAKDVCTAKAIWPSRFRAGLQFDSSILRMS